MRSLRHLLPSAGHLIVFEAAGRLGSFTQAGRELGMSQAAVSYAIRGLEDQLGLRLFQRGHRRVGLTDVGARFFADVTQGLGLIRKSAEVLRAAAHGAQVTLAASTAFASFWMMPRLQTFRDDLPGIDLRLQTSDRDLDLTAENIPLGVRGGDPEHWPEYGAMLLAPEEILAVASPGYLRDRGSPVSPAELVDHRLIHLDEPFRPAADWADWFRSAGLDPGLAPKGLVINDYALVIQAAMEGQGVALGWRHLTERLLRSGLLAQVTAHAMRTPAAYCVIWPKAEALSSQAQTVRDWLVAQR